jgi:hypothetical protein
MHQSVLLKIRLRPLCLAVMALGGIIAQGLGTTAAAQATWYNCLTREAFTPEKQVWCDRWQAVQNADYIVPTSLTENPAYTTVTLENGRYEQSDGEMLVVLANEQNWLTFGDIDGDGKEDAAVIFGVVPDGTALATYLTVLLDIDGSAQAVTPIVLGERIMLNGPITIDNARVTVPFLTSTAVLNRSYVVDGSSLLELTQLPVPEETLVDTEDTDSSNAPRLTDVPSPVGGTVQQLTLPGPETSVLIVCDREGFEPFLFTDQGNWVGCRIRE